MAQASVEAGKKQELELQSVLEVEIPDIVISQEQIGETSLSKRILKFIKKSDSVKEIRTIESVKNLQNYRQRAIF